MTALLLDLRQQYAKGFLEVGAVATVRLIAHLDGRPVLLHEWWQTEVAVPIAGQAGESDKTVSVTVPAGGNYSVTVSFPRGDDLMRQVRVDEGEVLTVKIELAVSPHEYLAWQQFSGSVRAHPYEREPEAAMGEAPEGRVGDLLVAGSTRLRHLYDEERAVPTVSVALVAPGRAAWEQLGAAGASRDPAFAGPPPSDWPNPMWDAEFAAWFHAPTRDQGVDLVQGLRDGVLPDELRSRFPRWLAFRANGSVDLVSVPWAWWGWRRNDDEEIQFFYDRVRPSPITPDIAGRLRLSVRDERWFGLLEYLGAGRLDQASQLLEPALDPQSPTEMLFTPEGALLRKTKGPLVATAGAIMLIAEATSTQERRWDPWLDNLANWYPGIPDGAILLGCRRAEQARDQAALQQAFGHIREGVERGIPFFAATMRMASIALARMGSDVEGADTAMVTIAAVSSRVDPEQPFTLIRLR